MNANQINVAVIGVGWIGEIRAAICAKHPLVRDLYLVETNEARAAEVAARTGARKWTTDHRSLLGADVDAVIIAATPETVHHPIAREWLSAGKHVLLEKPMGVSLAEADDLIEVARRAGVKLAIGYSQRFNTKNAYAKQCMENGTLGRPISTLISRHATRTLAGRVAGRGKLGPVQMEGTHDIDLVLWWMAPAKPTRVYCQMESPALRDAHGLLGSAWTLVTMDNGAHFTIGSNWNLVPEAPNFVPTTIEIICTDGALFLDDSHRDVMLNTVKTGLIRPMSSMPGEQVGHVFAGPMEAETRHFLECVAFDRPVLVTPEQARQVMEVCFAADLSVERGQPIDLPLKG